MPRFHTRIPTWLLCSVRAGNIGSYPEMRLDKAEKPERLNYNLWVVRVILERISNVCVGEFGVSPPSAIRTYEVSCVDHSFLR